MTTTETKSQQRSAWNKAITPLKKGEHTLQQFLAAARIIDPRIAEAIAKAIEGIYFGTVGAVAVEVPGSGGIWFTFHWYADPNSCVEPKVEFAHFS